MRFRAFLRGCVLLAALSFLTGCASATKKHYLKHLSATIAPAGPAAQPPAIAAAEE